MRRGPGAEEARPPGRARPSPSSAPRTPEALNGWVADSLPPHPRSARPAYLRLGTLGHTAPPLSASRPRSRDGLSVATLQHSTGSRAGAGDRAGDEEVSGAGPPYPWESPG